jgi:hypothetical protein
MQIDELIKQVTDYLHSWEEGDNRPAIIYVEPLSSQILVSPRKLQIRVSWDRFKAEVCTDILNQYRFLDSDPRSCIVQGLKAISVSSGHGKISINPRRKAKAVKRMIEFDIIWIISCRIKVPI